MGGGLGEPAQLETPSEHPLTAGRAMPPLHVLFVCTGNICRSPFAAAVLNQLADRDELSVEATSVGTLPGVRRPTPELLEVAADAGMDLSAHVSRHLDAAAVGAADLVIGLARQHVREVVVLVPEAWPRTFTLREIVRRAGPDAAGAEPEVDPEPEAGAASGREVPDETAGETLATWLARLGADREPPVLLGEDPADDVADPIGLPLEAYRTMAKELDELVSELARYLGSFTGRSATLS